MLQKRAELQELEEELRRKEEVLLYREACLQQKNKLEIKMLRSSQVSPYSYVPLCDLVLSLCYDLVNIFISSCLSMKLMD